MDDHFARIVALEAENADLRERERERNRLDRPSVLKQRPSADAEIATAWEIAVAAREDARISELRLRHAQHELRTLQGVVNKLTERLQRARAEDADVDSRLRRRVRYLEKEVLAINSLAEPHEVYIERW